MNKIKLISFNKKCQLKSELASHSIGSGYPLKGCSSAEPFSVLPDQINIQVNIQNDLLTQFKLHSLSTPLI